MPGLLEQIEGGCVDAFGFPRPQWKRIREWMHARSDDLSQDAFVTLQREWLDRLRIAFTPPFRTCESEDFLLLTSPRGEVSWILDYAQETRRTIFQLVGHEHPPRYNGTCVLLVLNGDHVFRQYTRFYMSDGNPRAHFGAMWINDGYMAQIVLPSLQGFKPILSHEMTHLCLSNMKLPRWLDEGIAQRISQVVARRPRPDFGNAIKQRLRGFWRTHSIQLFWSGSAFLLRGVDLASMAYELAHLIVRELAERDIIAFQQIVGSAQQADSGEAAFLSHLGRGLGEALRELLGDGDWSPKPATWGA